MSRAMVVLLAALAAATTSCADPAVPHQTTALAPSRTSFASATVSAKDVGPDPRVGAIFLGGPSTHTCTGSVLHSAAGDLILTAAHCMAGGLPASFVPGFANSAEPQDFWQIGEVYLDPRWLAGQDPSADFAIARVGRAGAGSIESAVGRGFDLGPAPEVGTAVNITGYPVGDGGEPIGCATRTAASVGGFPALRCAGLVDGTSGSPWTTGSTAVGVIGGLEGGGCEESVSYTPPFDDAVKRLLVRAEAAGPGDTPPALLESDC